MLIIAIVAVGSVSAAENATIDIADEPASDIVVEDVAADDVDESASDVEEDITADVNDDTQGTRQDYDVDEYTTDIQAVINSHETGNHVVSFKPINYTNVALTIHGNVTLIGNGATLIGGTNNIFTIDNATNFTVTGFNIVTPNNKAAFYGANVNDSKIINNHISGGKDGINIKETYSNVTISGNTITGFTRDGISLVNHDILDNLDNLKTSIVSNNRVIGGEVGLFFGGNFKGTISDNGLYSCQYGMQFVGKPTGNISKIHAVITRNGMSGVESGIYFVNETAVSLNIIDTEIYTLDYYNNYTIDYGENFSIAEAISINLYHNILSGSIKQSFINMTYVFDNWFDGEIHYDE